MLCHWGFLTYTRKMWLLTLCLNDCYWSTKKSEHCFNKMTGNEVKCEAGKGCLIRRNFTLHSLHTVITLDILKMTKTHEGKVKILHVSKVGREFIFFRKSKPLVNKHQCCRWPWLCTQQICDIIGHIHKTVTLHSWKRLSGWSWLFFSHWAPVLAWVKREHGHNIRCIVLSGFIRMKSPPLQVSGMSRNVMVHVIQWTLVISRFTVSRIF